MLTDDEIIAFKGTRHGALVSIKEDAEFPVALMELGKKIIEKNNFFQGAPISLDLGWREMSEEDFDALQQLFEEKAVKLQGIISSSQITRSIAESRKIKAIIGRLGLAEHGSRAAKLVKQQVKQKESEALKPEELTLLVKKTLRSGQKISFQGNVVVMGDVNPGAEVKAGGDVIVLGALRGMAHAGSERKESSQVFAFQLLPAQLRIGDLMGWIEFKKQPKGLVPEVAKVVNGNIVISAYTDSGLLKQG